MLIRDGSGDWRPKDDTQVRLPMGVTAAELLSSAKVELLAGNLGRHRHEVWPQRETDTAHRGGRRTARRRLAPAAVLRGY